MTATRILPKSAKINQSCNLVTTHQEPQSHRSIAFGRIIELLQYLQQRPHHHFVAGHIVAGVHAPGNIL